MWIDKEHPIFASEAYRRERLLFRVLDRTINPTAFLRLSDGESYVLARNHLALSAWLWTRDDRPLDGRVLDALRIHFAGRPVLVTAKEAAAKQIEAYFEALGHRMTRCLPLVLYLFDTLHPPDTPEGRPALPGDMEALVQMKQAFYQICFGKTPAEDPRPALRRAMEKGLAYVVERDGGPVGMALITEDELGVCVNQVYVMEAYRNRGLARALVHCAIAPRLQAHTPIMLYADADNPASNRTYQKLGFVKAGRLNEICLEEEGKQ